MVQISRLKNQRWSNVIGRGGVKSVLRHIADGADINAKDEEDGATPLIRALQYDSATVAEALIERGAKVNARDKDGETALMIAAIGAQPEAVKVLLDAGADVRAADNDGLTALTFAKEGKNPETIRLLENALSL